MAKALTQFVCQNCGSVFPKWNGQCVECKEWNSLIEEQIASTPKGLDLKQRSKSKALDFVSLKGAAKPLPRIDVGLEELNRTLGGGLVPGSAILVGGDPGIGKSTILLQTACALASKGRRSFYISGEESIDQIRLRAKRLGLENTDLFLASETNLARILKSFEGSDTPDFVVIDSIQTIYLSQIDSAPGSVSQVRSCSNELINSAKKKGITLVLVGHVTKEGSIAGPRVLEHMVDTVLYFEGDRGHQFRILRAVKNRFGPTNEIGVFEMCEKGLREVTNPSELFLKERDKAVSGISILAAIEGTRPVLVEIQALVAPTHFATPRRSVIGWDTNRLAMILAVLETRCGFEMSGQDIYLNVAGGLKIHEPAADLAVAAALISAHTGKILPHDMVIFGEIGLSGEIRAVSQRDLRLKETAKLGFDSAMLPALKGKEKNDSNKLHKPLSLLNYSHVNSLHSFFQNL